MEIIAQGSRLCPAITLVAVASTVTQTAVFGVGQFGAASISRPSAVNGVNGVQNNLNLPGENRLNGTPFTIRARGTFLFSAGTYTASIQPMICVGTPGFTASASNAVYSVAAQAVTVAFANAVLPPLPPTTMNVPWRAEISFIGNNTSGLSGSFTGDINNGATQLVPLTVAANLPSSVNFLMEPPLQFAAMVTCTGNGSQVTAVLYELACDK